MSRKEAVCSVHMYEGMFCSGPGPGAGGCLPSEKDEERKKERKKNQKAREVDSLSSFPTTGECRKTQ